MRLMFKGEIIRADKARKPKMQNVHGKTWEKFPITVDGKKVDAHLDTSFGQYFFFELKKQWYACRLIQWAGDGTTSLEIDPTKKLEVSTVEKFQRIYEEV